MHDENDSEAVKLIKEILEAKIRPVYINIIRLFKKMVEILNLGVFMKKLEF